MYCASLVSFVFFYSHLFIRVPLMMEMIVFYFISINRSLLYMPAHILSVLDSSLYPTRGEGSEHTVAKYFISSWIEPWKRVRQSRDRAGNVVSGHTGLEHVIWH